MLAAKAIGDAQIREALLKAEAIGLKALSEIAKTPEGQIVLWIKTLETALSKASYSIIPGSDLYSAASGLQEMLNKVKGGIK